MNAAFLVPDEGEIRKVVQSMRADAQDLVVRGADLVREAGGCGSGAS
ncbi:MAG: hypothetical protein U1F35_05250 [Steroidobacteraceae bacterium]